MATDSQDFLSGAPAPPQIPPPGQAPPAQAPAQPSAPAGPGPRGGGGSELMKNFSGAMTNVLAKTGTKAGMAAVKDTTSQINQYNSIMKSVQNGSMTLEDGLALASKLPLFGKNKEMKETFGKAGKIQQVVGKVLQTLGQAAMPAPQRLAQQNRSADEAAEARKEARQHSYRMEEESSREKAAASREFDPRKIEFARKEEEARLAAQHEAKKADEADREKVAERIGLPKGSQEYNEFVLTGKYPQQKSYNLRPVMYKTPGSEDLHEGYQDPRDPSRVFEGNTGKLVEAGAYNLVDKSIEMAKERAKYWGPYGNYYRAARGKGLSDDQAASEAGDLVFKEFGVRMGRQEQQMAIDAALSGLGGRPDIPKLPKADQPKVAPSSVAEPKVSEAARRALPPPPKTPNPLGLSSKESEDVLYYLSTLTGAQKGGGKAAAVRSQEGQRSLARVTGLGPLELASELSQFPAMTKQLGETVQRSGAIQRLTNTIDVHGKVLVGVADKVAQTNSPLLNQPIREWGRKAAGSPEYKRFVVALNEMQREYAYLTAGGAQSRAMLPVHTSESMDKIFSADSTLAEVKAAVDQVRIGSTTELGAMNKTIEDIKTQMRGGKVGGALQGPSGLSGSKANDPLGVL